MPPPEEKQRYDTETKFMSFAGIAVLSMHGEKARL